MALQTAVQRGSRQVRDRRVQGIEGEARSQRGALESTEPSSGSNICRRKSDEASVLANPPDWLRVFALVLDAQHR